MGWDPGLVARDVRFYCYHMRVRVLRCENSVARRERLGPRPRLPVGRGGLGKTPINVATKSFCRADSQFSSVS
jgi:hypothetical protein